MYLRTPVPGVRDDALDVNVVFAEATKGAVASSHPHSCIHGACLSF